MSESLVITTVGCAFVGEDPDAKPTTCDPQCCSGEYELDLSDTYERAVAVLLVERAWREVLWNHTGDGERAEQVGDNLSAAKLDGQSFSIPEEDQERPWAVPQQGKLSLRYKHTMLVTH